MAGCADNNDDRRDLRSPHPIPSHPIQPPPQPTLLLALICQFASLFVVVTINGFQMALTITFMLLKKQQQQQQLILLFLLNKDSIFIRALSSTSTSTSTSTSASISTSTSLYPNFNPNGQLFQSSLRYVDRRQTTTPTPGATTAGGGSLRQVVLHMHGSSLSLSRLHHSPHHSTLHRLNCQVPHLMPHPPPLSLLRPLQEKLKTLFLAPPNPPPPPPPTITTNRALCSRVSNGDSDSETADVENCEGVQCENVNSMADWKEVDRVCKVVDELLALDRNMEAVLDECGVVLNHDLVVQVLERFRHARRSAFRFFCWAGQRPSPGYSHNSRTYNKMMLILGKARQFETMVIVLEEMGERELLTLETFQIAIKAFAEAQERKKAVGIFELMKKVKNLMEAGKVWNDMTDKGFKPDIVAHHTMLEGLLRCRKRSDAIKLFEVMKSKGPCPSVRCYTILIRDLCKQMKMREGVEYFEEMLDYGCEPDAVVYTCLITGFGNQKKMDKVYGLLKEMKEKGCPPDVQTYNALIKLMTNRQMPDDAVRIYKKMIQSGFQPTIHTYNMMMKSYFQTKNYDMGCAVWAEMIRKGCCPDDNSYIVLIGGLIRRGRSEEACKYVEEMIEKGMKAPQLDHNKFAADFSRIGKPDILEELSQKMKFSRKFEASNLFGRWAKMIRNRVKRRSC
ncbi:hypothetical protein ACSBR2_033898 [Camellia fascicularis]